MKLSIIAHGIDLQVSLYNSRKLMTKLKPPLIASVWLLDRYINSIKIGADQLRKKAVAAVGMYGQPIDSWYHTPEISVCGV